MLAKNFGGLKISELLPCCVALFWLLPALTGCQMTDPRESRPFYFDFETAEEMDWITWECGELFARTRDFASHGEWALRLEMFPGAYPGLKIYKFQPDWSGFHTLKFDIYNPGASPVTLRLVLEDKKQSRVDERYLQALEIQPGANRFEIPLERLWRKDGLRRLETSHIEGMYLILTHPREKVMLYFDYLHLE